MNRQTLIIILKDCLITSIKATISKVAYKLTTHAFTISADHTAKFLVGVTPSGVVGFSSSAYPGMTTDKEIVMATKVLDQLEVGDNVMADKGFLIDELLPDGINLI